MTPLPDYLLHPILANPADDLLRLSAADWWEENGESELAEFVRLQIAKFHDKKNSPREQKLYYRFAGEAFDQLGISDNGFRNEYVIKTFSFERGWPKVVRLSMRQFMGGECERCNGHGYVCECDPDSLDSETCFCSDFPCPDCTGLGRAPGLAKWIGKNWPVEKATPACVYYVN